MANRRQPLAEVPNKLNSPYRGSYSTAAIAGKRTRAADPRDATLGQPPPKKQALDSPGDETENVDPNRRLLVNLDGDETLVKRTTIQPTALERKLFSAAAGGDRRPAVQQQQQQQQQQQHQQRTDGAQRAHDANVENVRQWQRHYRKQFPTFVFYFDGVADDVRAKVVRQIQSLDGREEKFFSKAVNHVVTTRPIPGVTSASTTGPDDEHARILRLDECHAIASTSLANVGSLQSRPTQLLDANLQRRGQPQPAHPVKDIDPRKTQPQSVDVLSRARDLGIKIWALEKLQRILKTILDGNFDETDTAAPRNQPTAGRTATRHSKDASLEQLLRNEKVNGPADRDLAVAAQNMTEFRGCFIYIHDMDEKTKPTLLRDYTRPDKKEQGKWPQFRLTPVGRCPFVEDVAHTKRLQAEEKRAADEAAAARRQTRAASTANPTLPAQQRVLTECQPNLRRSPRKMSQDVKLDVAKPLEPPMAVPARRQSSADTDAMPSLFGSAQVIARGAPRMAGGQPVASGVQPSNVTSAIRSQVVSSAAISSTAAIGRRLPDSKEVSALKRKVLERGTSAMSNQSMPSSYLNDMRAALNTEREPPPRAAKRKAQETLGIVHEDGQNYHRDSVRGITKPKPTKRSKKMEKEPKPGFCENCRDKFDDFDEHIQSRKHRKFALTDSNWKELDALLVLLKRRRRDCSHE